MVLICGGFKSGIKLVGQNVQVTVNLLFFLLNYRNAGGAKKLDKIGENI
jgi:hypothetical protein